MLEDSKVYQRIPVDVDFSLEKFSGLVSRVKEGGNDVGAIHIHYNAVQIVDNKIDLTEMNSGFSVPSDVVATFSDELKKKLEITKNILNIKIKENNDLRIDRENLIGLTDDTAKVSMDVIIKKLNDMVLIIR